MPPAERIAAAAMIAATPARVGADVAKRPSAVRSPNPSSSDPTALTGEHFVPHVPHVLHAAGAASCRDLRSRSSTARGQMVALLQLET